MNVSLGRIFRIHRRQKDKKLKEFVPDISIPMTKLNDFELGKCSLSDSVMKELYACLNIEYHNDEEDIKEFQNLFYLFYQDIFDYKPYVESYHKLEQTKNKVQTTLVYPQYLLAEFIFYVFAHKQDLDFKWYMDIIEEYFLYLDDKQKLIYYDTAGIYYRNVLDVEKSLSYFDKASIYGYAPATAMMLYHKGAMLDMNNELNMALNCLIKARDYFVEEVNIRRVLLCTATIAGVYSRLGCYDKAAVLCRKCIPHMMRYELHKDVLMAYNNLAWNYILNGYYTSSIETANEMIKLNDEDSMAYFYLSYAYEKLGDHEKAKAYIKLAKKHIDDCEISLYLKKMIFAFYTLLSAQKSLKTKVKKVKDILNSKDVQVDLEGQIFALEMLIHLLKESDQQEELYYYTACLADCYKKRK